MRVAYVSVSDQLGGSEMALLAMVAALRRSRPSWALHVILPGRGPLFDRLQAAGAACVVESFPESLVRLGEFATVTTGWSPGARASFGLRLVRAALSLPEYERRLRNALSAINPDVVHSNGLKAHVLAARNKSHGALVWHMHEYIGRRAATRTLLRRLVARSDAIVANSSSVAADTTRGINPRRAPQVIYNAVDLHVFHPDAPAADLDRLSGLPPPSSPVLRVGLVATLARWKGHATFLRALARLPADDAVRGYVIGAPLYGTTGSQHTIEQLRRLTADLGLAGRVGFTGFADAAPAIRALDIVVHASTEPEPFGMVIAEAMACGRALITSGTGGAAELIDPGKDALTHVPGDASSLAACMVRLARNAALRERLGSHARRSAERRFSPERLASELASMYETMVDRSRVDACCAVFQGGRRRVIAAQTTPTHHQP
jgi:glycosyltransferase involved in cell wall biosynthesis